MSRLEGKVAIVTGASRGIGAAIATAMAREGAQMVICARKAEALEACAAAIRELGAEVLAQPTHVGHEDQVQSLLEAAVARFGKVDVLVNNAATNPYFGPMMNVPWSIWDKTFEVNVKGYFATSRAFAKHLLGRGAPGAIVNITSVLGDMGAPLQGVYGMTKAAVISMSRTLAVELGEAGIRVNAIAPGLVQTRFSQALVDNEEIREMIVQRTALRRYAQPEEIAGAAVFLASDEASYVTGTVLTVDGGWTTA